jgi:hypothetical protein
MKYIFPIVEGHGEVEAVPVLLRRIAYECIDPVACDIFRPFRLPRQKIVQFGQDLANAIKLGKEKIDATGSGGGIIIFADADDDCPVHLQSKFKLFSKNMKVLIPTFLISPNKEYEAWFIACAEKMRCHQMVRSDASSHPDPESVRDAKGYFDREVLIPTAHYSETVDQAKFSSVIDFDCLLQTSRSFKKLYESSNYLLRSE